jgi:aconitate hydratase
MAPGATATLRAGDLSLSYAPLGSVGNVERLPYSLRILLENALRFESESGVEAVAQWQPQDEPSRELGFRPSRVLLQDFTGVPAIVDVAAMRSAMADLGGDPGKINPHIPAELVIDHSVQVDAFATRLAIATNVDRDYERNGERYAFLRWGQGAFDNLKVVPPNTGIVHQVNLEYLARVVEDRDGVAFPDTLVGTDSHTTMVNGLGVLGWGVGGIEAEAAMLGQPMSMLIPQVIGFKLTGELREGATATDLVLTVTEQLRAHGVVGKFVEFYGAGVGRLPLADRATIGNMSPEFGSTCAIFPIDAETLRYLEFSGRAADHIERVEAYARAQGLWHDEHSEPPTYSETLELELGDVVPSLAGPKRPQDRVSLMESKASFRMALDGFLPEPDCCDEPLEETFPASDPTSPQEPKHPAESHGEEAGAGTGGVQVADRVSVSTPLTLADGTETELDHGHVVIAAITSCTNTSNPSVMIGAGLLARNAAARGLKPKPWVKTSLAPGSKVVMEYYRQAGLVEPLEALGFHLVGYGCTTCIGNSGPLPEEVSAVVQAEDLAVVSVLSGNRNFEGRINPDVKMNYLASPPLVVAYALAGTMDIDLLDEPLGQDTDGNDVMLSDIWPSSEEVGRVVEESVRSEMFQASYGEVFEGDERWNSLEVPEGDRFAWAEDSTYVRLPPFFADLPREPQPRGDVEGARVLALLGDSVTTDHISPAGSIKKDSPAARYLNEHGVEQKDFNSYGSRRGNHEVMMRGTFANIRLRNLIAGRDDLVGGLTLKQPEGEVMPIYDAAMRYAEDDTPLVVLAGKEYGSGSSRDWAAKGTALLGVRAVIAESFERIHRSNLVGMGVLPLQFPEGESAESLGLTGEEEISITGVQDGEAKEVSVRAGDTEFTARVRIDTPKEVDYFKHGGILPFVLRQLLDRGA